METLIIKLQLDHLITGIMLKANAKRCEALAEIILQNYQQIKEVQGLCDTLKINPVGFTDTLPVLNNQVTELLSILIKRTFIIEQQPPQVIKTNSRFTSTVRVLVGGQSNLHMTLPQVSVSIISGAQANDLMKNDTITDRESSGEILNNVGTMEWNKRTRQLSVSFKNMQLKKIKRAGKKGNASVKNEKHSLLFQYEFKVDELSFQVWTLSLPVVVIVHGNQESGSWGTISWDNAFAELGRVQFEIPEKVPWCKVADMLVCKFSALNGRGLSEENLRYLAGKAFRNDQVEEYGSMMLSWPQFCKDPLPGCSFTFWEWVYENMKLLSEDLRALWNGGCILGYVGRNQTEEMLLSRTNYTFLLRFSESELGGITITWVAEAKESGKREVFRIQPFTNKDLVIRSLADRINDLKWLLYLYPEVPKDQAFRKYYTPMTCNISKSGNGYINSALVTHVPGFGPTTEQHISKLTQLDLEDVQSSDLERTMDFSELTNFNLGNILSIDLYTPMDFSSTRITLK